MSTQAVVTLTKPGRNFRGTFKLGDLALRMMAGLVLLFLFIPILVIIVFSFNSPAGKFNYTWQGFTFENWLHPFKYPALAKALRLSIEVAAISTAIAAAAGFTCHRSDPQKDRPPSRAASASALTRPW